MFSKNKKSKKDGKNKKSLGSRLLYSLFEEVEDDDTEEMRKVVDSKKRFTGFDTFFIGSFLLVMGVVVGCLVTMFTSSVFGYRIDAKTNEFLKTFNYVKDNYYEDVDDDSLIDSAISGMLDALGDEHSFYMDSESTDSFYTSADGKYTGVGITIQYKDDINTIIEIFKNSPAAKAGLKVGDVVVKVDDTDVTGKDSTEIANLISRDIGEDVNITVMRGLDTYTAKVTIGEIEIESVTSEVKEENGKKIGYIQISNFAANTYKQFKNSLSDLESNNIDSLIIDVRDNTGGHLSVVSNILDLFMKKGTVLYQVQDKNGTTKYKAKSNSKREYPVVVLTNSSSASASEILAACFKEKYKGATIVGTTTYGKGTAQQAITLSDGTSYKFTTQKWLTSKGEWINGVGVTPDVEVQAGEDINIDTQLDAAIKILIEK